MQRRIKLRIRNLRLGSGPQNAKQVASGMNRAISGALGNAKPDLAPSVAQATARAVIDSVKTRR